jgi:hypothetical protein
MHTEHGDPAELRHRFWKAMGQSPFVMLQLDADPDSAAPMTAQLDPDASHEIWFFVSRSSHLAAMGPATATFTAKGHDTFARFHGGRSWPRPGSPAVRMTPICSCCT